MDALLADMTRDLIAIVSLVLTALQTIVTLIQIWRSRGTSWRASQGSSPSTQLLLSMVMSDYGIRVVLSATALGMLLNILTTTGLYLGGLSGATESRAFGFMFPGIGLQSIGTLGFLLLLPEATKEASRRQATALVLVCACFTVLYFTLVYIFPWTGFRWLDLFKWNQLWTLGFLGFGFSIVTPYLIFEGLSGFSKNGNG